LRLLHQAQKLSRQMFWLKCADERSTASRVTIGSFLKRRKLDDDE
jgi:hypothetical protein